MKEKVCAQEASFFFSESTFSPLEFLISTSMSHLPEAVSPSSSRPRTLNVTALPSRKLDVSSSKLELDVDGRLTVASSMSEEPFFWSLPSSSSSPSSSWPTLLDFAEEPPEVPSASSSLPSAGRVPVSPSSRSHSSRGAASAPSSSSRSSFGRTFMSAGVVASSGLSGSTISFSLIVMS